MRGWRSGRNCIASLATRSAQSELVVARQSGHYIQNDEPALVIDAVRRVVVKRRIIRDVSATATELA